MSCLLHEVMNNGKRAEKILDIIKEARTVLAAYIECCEQYAPKNNDIFPMLAERGRESVKRMKELLNNPV